MRPLNRPMFRYGGPIKEGIMDGMREPKKNGGRMLLVGEHPQQFKDASGREQHFGPLVAIGSGLMAGLRALPVIARGIAMKGTPRAPGAGSFFRNLLPTGRFRTVPGKQRSPDPEFIKGDPTAFPGGPGPDKVLGLGEALKNPLLLGRAIRENPFTALGALPVAGTGIELIGRGIAGAAKMSPDALRAYANAVIPFGDPFTKKEEDVTTTEDGPGIKRGDPNKDKAVPAPDAGGTRGKSDSEKQIINEDRINETRQRYYKMMGLDKMKKDAVYDSLIDASRIVSEEGADLKGSIKSGSLQNRLIQALGKNLDKSAELKRAIDSAVLKGEIQKDINLTKPSAFAEQVEYIRNNPNDPLAKKLSGMRSVADDLALMADKPITSDIVARSVQSKGTKVKDVLDDTKFQKWEKNNENKDEIDYLQEITKGASLDPGIYIINKKAFRVDEDGDTFPVDLDSIIG